MFKPTKLALAISLAVGTSAAGLGTAQAGVAYFPFSAVSNTVTTIFSVINTRAFGINDDKQLHYRYYYKPYPDIGALATDEEIEDAWNNEHCEEVNKNLPTSRNDIQTIDIADALPDSVQGVMFNDPSVNNDWFGKGGVTGYALAKNLPKPHRGYLVVEHLPGDAFGGAELYGEAIIFEFGSGASWGYQAFDNDANDVNFTRFASASPNQVAIFPFEDTSFVTKFMVAPLWTRGTPSGGGAAPDVMPENENWNTVDISLESDPGFGFDNVAIYDRDENPISGARQKRVVCTGAVTAKYLLNDGAAGEAPDGGWSGVTNVAQAYSPYPFLADFTEPGAILFKLEFGNTSDINPGSDGVFNNAFYLHPDIQ